MAILNGLLLIVQFFCVLAFASTLMMRRAYEEISDQLFGNSSPLMGSVLADSVLQPWWAALLVPLLAFSLWKEWKLPSLRARAAKNLGIILTLMVIQVGLVALLYGPVFDTPHL